MTARGIFGALPELAEFLEEARGGLFAAIPVDLRADLIVAPLEPFDEIFVFLRSHTVDIDSKLFAGVGLRP